MLALDDLFVRERFHERLGADLVTKTAAHWSPLAYEKLVAQ